MAARGIWRLHGVLLPLLFVPCLFSVAKGPGVAGAIALDSELPQGKLPVAFLLNPLMAVQFWCGPGACVRVGGSAGLGERDHRVR